MHTDWLKSYIMSIVQQKSRKVVIVMLFVTLVELFSKKKGTVKNMFFWFLSS